MVSFSRSIGSRRSCRSRSSRTGKNGISFSRCPCSGFIYALQGREPLEYLNPHHLLWVPIQALVLRVASIGGLEPTLVLQWVGILINLATLLGFYRLVRLIQPNRWIAAAWTTFLGLTPLFYFLGSQNQPYSLALLCLVIFLHAWRYAETSSRPAWRPLAVAGLALALAILLQQAAVLLVFGAAAAWVAADWPPSRSRLITATCWTLAIGLLVAFLYMAAAGLQGILTPEALREWL